MKITGFETRGFTVHQVHSQICLLKWYLCIVLLIWVWISATFFFPTRTESSCSLTQPFPVELWNTGQPQALVAGGHTSGHPTLKTTALNAACFVPLIWPTLPPSVGTGSRGYTVTDPSKARNKLFWQFSDWEMSHFPKDILEWLWSAAQWPTPLWGRQGCRPPAFCQACAAFHKAHNVLPLQDQSKWEHSLYTGTALNTHPCIQGWSVLHSPAHVYSFSYQSPNFYPQLHGQRMHHQRMLPWIPWNGSHCCLSEPKSYINYVSRGEPERSNSHHRKYIVLNVTYKCMQESLWTAVINWSKLIVKLSSLSHINQIPTSISRPITVMVDGPNFAVHQTLK